jgi:hypothetical protein
MKRLTYLVVILLVTANSFAQGHFAVSFSGAGHDHMTIYVVNAIIGTTALEAGDEIAVFDGSVCCGIVTLSQPIVTTSKSTFALVAASQKDNWASNGFTVGHVISYKFWDASQSKEYSGLMAEYLDASTGQPIATPTFTANETVFVKLSAAVQSNQIPVSNAGTNQSVNEGGTVSLDGSASSDADGDPLTYHWTAPAGIILSSVSIAKPTFTAPQVSTDTPYTFSLIVNDGRADSQADEVVITVLQVNQVNHVPVANAGPNQSVNEGVAVSLDGSGSSDPDGDGLTYQWTAPAGITLNSDTNQKPGFTAPDVSADTPYTFSLVVNDGKINSPVDEVVITVLQVNKQPVANAGNNQTVNEGSAVSLNGSASSDPDGNALTYKWTAPAGIVLSSDTDPNPGFTAPQVSANTPYTFSLTVNDGLAGSPADQVVVTVLNVDHAPYVKNAIQNISVDKGAPDQVIDLKTVFADDDFGDVLNFSVISNTNNLVVVTKIMGSNLTLDFSSVNIGLSELVVTASSNGKEVNSKFTVEVKIPTQVDPTVAENPEIQIYPNPTKGIVKLTFSQRPKSGTFFSVYNLSGNIIYQAIANETEKNIDLTGFPEGLYILKVDGKMLKLIKF